MGLGLCLINEYADVRRVHVPDKQGCIKLRILAVLTGL